MSTPMSPRSPTRVRRPKRNSDAIPGMIVAPRPKVKPIEEMDMNELHALYAKNEGILLSPSASSSSVATRVSAEQAQVRARIWELERREMEELRGGMNKVAIVEDFDMEVDTKTSMTNGNSSKQTNGRGPAQTSARVLAKQRALAAWGPQTDEPNTHKTETMPLEEALELEKRAYERETARQRRIQEKKERWGCQWPARDQPMTREEREARIWAFMNYKPTDSDLEDEDDEDEDDDDPSSWFYDDQDDGKKGQDIVYPDEDLEAEELAHIIRLDEARAHHRMYERYDDGD